VDDLLLLLNYHWARDTSTFPTERHRVQFALILLFLFGTGCRPAELVDAKKKKRDDIDSETDELQVLDDDDTLAFDEIGDGSGVENSQGPTVHDDNAFDNDDTAMRGMEEDIRRFDAICYEDVRLLVVRSPESEERDVLAMEITLAHHKGHKRRPKP
jgi:hypothetical protein